MILAHKGFVTIVRLENIREFFTLYQAIFQKNLLISVIIIDIIFIMVF